VRSPGTQGALSTLFVFYLAAFAGFLLWAVLSLPDLFPVFKWPYLWTAAFVRFVDYAIPVTVAGLAVAYSLFMRAGGGGQRPFHKVVGSQLTLLVALTVLYTAVLFGFYPRSRTLLTELEELTRQGRALLEAARADSRLGRQQAALDAYERYLAINRRDEKATGERNKLRLAMHVPPPVEAEQKELPALEQAQGLRPEELLAKARGYFEREDWFSANYYAHLAVQVSGDRPDAVSREAARLEARAWERIRSLDPGKMQKEQGELFGDKRSGYAIFQRGDYLAAYYHFLQLARRYPDDADAKSYLRLSREQVVKLTYFLDEAERMDPLPGPQGLLFLNNRPDGAREIVSIGKMVVTTGETFFKDIEVLRIVSGRVVLHYLAPYGKLEESETPPAAQGQAPDSRAGILLHGIDRQRPGRDSRPNLLAGSLRGEEPRYLLGLAPRPGELAALRAPGPAGLSRLGGVGLDTLWLAREGIGAFGQMESVLSLEILMRLLLPFAFLNLGLLAMAMGWSYRLVTPRRPPAVAYLVIPLFPVAAALLAGVYLKIHRTLAAFAQLAWGFRPALVGLAVLEGAILAVMLIVLAGRVTD
jgi:tetratricopeptide (TPR) repeat protein